MKKGKLMINPSYSKVPPCYIFRGDVLSLYHLPLLFPLLFCHSQCYVHGRSVPVNCLTSSLKTRPGLSMMPSLFISPCV